MSEDYGPWDYDTPEKGKVSIWDEVMSGLWLLGWAIIMIVFLAKLTGQL